MGLETSSQFHAAPEDASPTQQPYLSLGTSTGLLQAFNKDIKPTPKKRPN